MAKLLIDSELRERVQRIILESRIAADMTKQALITTGAKREQSVLKTEQILTCIWASGCYLDMTTKNP
jgi:hypothetical protein